MCRLSWKYLLQTNGRASNRLREKWRPEQFIPRMNLQRVSRPTTWLSNSVHRLWKQKQADAKCTTKSQPVKRARNSFR